MSAHKNDSPTDSPLDPRDELADLPQRAVELAAEILKASRENESADEKSRSAMMARMMNDPPGKKFTIAMADQVLRMERPGRAARRMSSLIDEYGVPKYFGSLDRMALSLGTKMASWLPKRIMPFVKSKVRKDSAHVIISAEDKEFAAYLAERKKARIRVNFNQLGEAVLGDREADRRLRDNIKRLTDPGVDYISVKLSSIVSQISLTGYQQTIEDIKPRLRELYRAAIKGGGPEGAKFVNLDMEEYRDLHLTVDVFMAVLGESEFDQFEAGIVLQAYLPDSFEVFMSLSEWAAERYDRTGGTGIKIRIVKGANLAMESVEASIRDWPQAPYHTKLDVDANYKRMLRFATRPEVAAVVRIGVGSHNLFDIAYALLLREKRNVLDRIEFEMLEGMSNAQSLEVQKRSGGMLVYAPVVLDAEFESAVAYLVRRLDENTAPGSFLGALFALQEGTPEWDEQVDAFLKACERSHDPGLLSGPHRVQNRIAESPILADASAPFHNAPDTDFAIPVNREWCANIHREWEDKTPDSIPLQINGEFIGLEEGSEKMSGKAADPSRPGHLAYRYAKADAGDIELALGSAVAAQRRWQALSVADRALLLRQVAVEFSRGRGESIGAMMLDAGKAVSEGDVEVSEAVDFANYYARVAEAVGWNDGTVPKPLGVVVITPPWNFPYAIPAGGILAALMAGNSVILKPAPESVLTSWILVQQMWRAGIPKDVLQFVPANDDETGKQLIVDPRTAAVILTGSFFTARMFQSWRPELRLYAETSGKNSMIISAAADLDLAVKDLVRGAFGHAGQKCSATSLGVVEAEVYDNPKFMNQLKDAAQSLKVGGSWNLSAVVTPVIREPDEFLKRGLTVLEPGESWLLQPNVVDNNPCLWSPGIRIGVKPGSWYHRTECFGPVLGLIRAENLDDAIRIQNDNQFGLTGGIHSLDPQEVEVWRRKVEVGNAYVNRTTTGAIVQRQPFGGWKDSCVGPGPKAGGPNYVSAFSSWEEQELPKLTEPAPNGIASQVAKLLEIVDSSERERVERAAGSYVYWWNKEFSSSHDPSQIHGETNDFRYRPRPFHLVRMRRSATQREKGSIAMLAIACQITGCTLQVSQEDSFDWVESLGGVSAAQVFTESHAELLGRLSKNKGGSLRIIGDYDPGDFAPAEIGGNPIVDAHVVANGRIELLHLLKEQSITETVHRYGNIV